MLWRQACASCLALSSPGALMAARQTCFALQVTSAIRCPHIEVGSRANAEPLAIRVILAFEWEGFADAISLSQNIYHLQWPLVVFYTTPVAAHPCESQ